MLCAGHCFRYVGQNGEHKEIKVPVLRELRF